MAGYENKFNCWKLESLKLRRICCGRFAFRPLHSVPWIFIDKRWPTWPTVDLNRFGSGSNSPRGEFEVIQNSPPCQTLGGTLLYVVFWTTDYGESHRKSVWRGPKSHALFGCHFSSAVEIDLFVFSTALWKKETKRKEFLKNKRSGPHYNVLHTSNTNYL
jgi:hypothetical protein